MQKCNFHYSTPVLPSKTTSRLKLLTEKITIVSTHGLRKFFYVNRLIEKCNVPNIRNATATMPQRVAHSWYTRRTYRASEPPTLATNEPTLYTTAEASVTGFVSNARTMFELLVRSRNTQIPHLSPLHPPCPHSRQSDGKKPHPRHNVIVDKEMCRE